MDFFSFTRKSKILLYGAAAVGHGYYDKLVSKGYYVEGFIDKRADEIKEFLGCKVWKADEIPIDFKEKEEYICIVAVKNVFEHDSIVELLQKNNFNRVIYKPYSSLSGKMNKELSFINSIYENILEEKSIEYDKIPCTNIKKCILEDNGFIREEGDMIIALIPVEFIYTDIMVGTRKIWGDLNILNLFTHIEMFEYFSRKEGKSLDNYIKEFCMLSAKMIGDISLTDAWKENIIRNRAQVYEEMNLSMQIDPDFFVRNAVEAVWNEKGYYNLTDGKHRVSFLVSKCFHFIPLRVSKESYDKFLNRDWAKKLLKEYGDMKITASIPNPLFYRYAYDSKEFYYNLYKEVINEIGKELFFEYGFFNFRTCQLTTILNDLGVIGSLFKKNGGNSLIVGVSEERIKILEKLMHIDGDLNNKADIRVEKRIGLFDESKYPEIIEILDTSIFDKVFMLTKDIKLNKETLKKKGYIFEKSFSVGFNGRDYITCNIWIKQESK